MAGLRDIMGARRGFSPPSVPGGGGPSRYAGHSVAPSRYFAEGGEVEEEREAEHEVTPDLKLAAYELLECLDNHSYADDKGGRAEALAKHLLAFFHLAEEMPHEEGPHVEEEPDEGGYDGGDEE